MRQRGKDIPVVTYGFLISVELEEDSPTSLEQVTGRFKDGLAYMEGVGHVDVECLGKIDIYNEEE